MRKMLMVAAVAALCSSVALAEQAIPKHAKSVPLIGTSVYAQGGENIGDVQDVLMGKKGKVTAVVVVTNCFFCATQKPVVVSLSNLRKKTTPSGELRLTVKKSAQ